MRNATPEVTTDSGGALAAEGASLAPAHPGSEGTTSSPTRSARGRSRRRRAAPDGARHTRISGAWSALAVAIVLGIALIDFIVENTRSVRVDFFSASGHLPVGVALLAAALAGAAVVLTVGVCRTAQLRLAIRRRARVSESATLAVVVSDAHRANGIVP